MEDTNILKKVALVTAIGSFSADIVIKNLKAMGFRVIGTDIYQREWIADANNVSEFYQVPKVVDEDAFFMEMDRICREEQVSYILPSTDIEVDFFAKHRDYFEKMNILVCISPNETIKICRNKRSQQLFIDEHVDGIQTIPTISMQSGEKAPFDFPMVCKPYDGRSSQGLVYVYTEEDWKAICGNSNVEKYIVQPYIKGNIVTVDVVRQKNGKTVVAIPRVELLRTANGAGTSVKVYSDVRLEEMCTRLANAFGIVGCVNFEFIQDEDGNYHYVECNPRFSGGVEFSCIAGYNCVWNHIKSFENRVIDDFSLVHDFYIARKYEEYVTKVE